MEGFSTGLAPGEAVLAVDVGGTDTKSALLDSGGRLVDMRRSLTARDVNAPGDAVAGAIAELAAEYTHSHPEYSVRALGVTAPGLVNEDEGVGVFSANLGWKDYPFGPRLAAMTGLPVGFGHDVGAAGEAEFRLGAARNCSDAVVMVIGTGIAGVIFCDGRRVSGAGYAGEIGHAQVPGGEPCPCGSTGCLETVASAASIARRYNLRTGDDLPGAAEVLVRADAADPVAAAVWQEAVEAIAFAICQQCSSLGTEMVVLGGGLSQAADRLLDPVRRAVSATLSFHRRPTLVQAALGQDAGLIGTALKALEAGANVR